MNENTNRLSQAIDLDGADGQSLRMVGSEKLRGKVPRACGPAAFADRIYEIKEIARAKGVM